MTTVQMLALKYAEALVAYHEAMQSDVCDKERQVRLARDEMYNAQTSLNQAAELEAELIWPYQFRLNA
jgi:hypothetical protein